MSSLVFVLIAAQSWTGQPALNTQEIVSRMVRADNARLAALTGYTGRRRYYFDNRKTAKTAELFVRVTCNAAGAKSFDIQSETGSGFVRRHILHRMLDAERKASERGERQQSRIIPDNYEFRLVGQENWRGRPAYVLEIEPRTKNEYLVRGRIWVDAEDFAIVCVDGSPAKNPSFWIRSAHIRHRYDRVGAFWLPAVNESSADARIFGRTDVQIEYFDYVVQSAQHPKRQEGE